MAQHFLANNNLWRNECSQDNQLRSTPWIWPVCSTLTILNRYWIQPCFEPTLRLNAKPPIMNQDLGKTMPSPRWEFMDFIIHNHLDWLMTHLLHGAHPMSWLSSTVRNYISKIFSEESTQGINLQNKKQVARLFEVRWHVLNSRIQNMMEEKHALYRKSISK